MEEITPMKMLSLILTGLMISVASVQAHALVDVRLTYGLLGSKPDLASMFPGTPGTLPDVTPTYGLGADIIVSPPFVPLGVGLRYENMGVTASTSGNEFKADYKRTSLLVNYRIIDTLLYLGPIFSYGLSHSGEIKATQPSGTSTWGSSSISSYSVGLEAGAKLIGFRVGAEAGYQDFRWKDATDSTGSGTKQDINMSGTYAKITVGFGI
jgi:hypothetical protein